MDTTTIASTIQRQINFKELMAIGAQTFYALPNTKTHLGGLQFSASLFGKKPVTVKVLLNGCDLYDITINSKLGSKKELLNITDIYCDQLTEIIINNIEKHWKSSYRV